MDGTTHTLIAVGLMAASFYTGKYLGRREAVTDFINTLLAVFKVQSLEITEDLEFFVYDNDGNERKVN